MAIAGGTLPSCSMKYEREWDRLRVFKGPNMPKDMLQMDVGTICDLLMTGKEVNLAVTDQRAVLAVGEMEKRVPGLMVIWN